MQCLYELSAKVLTQPSQAVALNWVRPTTPRGGPLDNLCRHFQLSQLGVLLVSGSQRPGFLLNILHYIGQLPTTNNNTSPNVNNADVQNCSRKQNIVIIFLRTRFQQGWRNADAEKPAELEQSCPPPPQFLQFFLNLSHCFLLSGPSTLPTLYSTSHLHEHPYINYAAGLFPNQFRIIPQL